MKTLKIRIITALLISLLVSILCFFCTTITHSFDSVFATEPDIVFGDVNKDGVLDVKDSIRLLKYLNDDTVEVDATLIDSNADDIVDGNDAQRIIDVINGHDLALYKTVNTPATCEADGLSARWSSKAGDANAYYNVLGKIKHEYGVECPSCGKTYVLINPEGSHTYSYSVAELYARMDNEFENMGASQAFDAPVTIIVDGTEKELTPTTPWKNSGIYFANLGTTTESTIVIPAGTKFISGDVIYVMQHNVTYTYDSAWVYSIDHTDADKDGNCDADDCEMKFVEMRVDSVGKWSHATSELYFYIDYDLSDSNIADGTNFDYVDPILFNGEPVNASLMKQAYDWLCFRGFGTGEEGSVITIPKGTRFYMEGGDTIYSFSAEAEIVYDGSNWVVTVNHVDEDFDGKCDCCDTDMVGLAITSNSRYGWSTTALYFNVNIDAFGDFGNYYGFQALTPVIFNGTETMLSIAKGDQAGHLYLSGFGEAVEGTTITVPEGFTFKAGDTLYYIRESITFTYPGSGNWILTNEYSSTFSTDPILVLNEDTDVLYRMNNYFDGDISDLENKVTTYYNEMWKDKGISDLILNIDNCIPSDYRTCNVSEPELMEYIWNHESGCDPIQTWIDMAREDNIGTWLSFRMNDVHWNGNLETASPFQKLCYENGWLLKDGGRTDYYMWCVDYTYEEVRQRFLDFIEETLSNYDVDGIELDWQREIYCFPQYTEENCQYMDEFMSDLEAIIDAAEVKYGHEIKVMARIMRDVEQNKLFGFDLVKWAQEGWVNVLVPSSHYGSTDSDMPIAEWIATFEPYGVEIIPGIECQVGAATEMQTTETISALANAYLGAGAEKIYAFNFMGGRSPLWPAMNSESGIMNYAKRYVVTEQNVYAWPPQTYQWKPLPMTVYGTKTLGIQVGQLRDSADKIIIVGVSAGVDVENLLSITANGTECTFIGETNNAYISSYGPSYKLYAFKVNNSVTAINNEVEFAFTSSSSAVVIQYIEFYNGFFA